MGRVLLISTSTLCLALVVSVGLALYTARTEADGVGVVSFTAEKGQCHKIAS